MKGLWIQLRFVLPLWFVQLITNWLPDNRLAIRVRGFLASFFIKSCGKNFQLGRDVTILNSFNLKIGDNVYIAKGTWLNAMAGLTVEEEVIVAPYVVISTLQHVFKDKSVRFGGSIGESVTIGRGTWLAAHSSIKCGVKVGKGNLVAANAFVVKDSPDDVILGGVPARIIKENQDGDSSFYSRTEFEKI